MTDSYTPRKKKIQGPLVKGAMKKVRIDAKTEIMVDVTIPDDVAINRYYERHKTAIRPPTDELEELASIVDDSLLPDLE